MCETGGTTDRKRSLIAVLIVASTLTLTQTRAQPWPLTRPLTLPLHEDRCHVKRSCRRLKL